MKKIDYSDLDAAEGVGHFFGFWAPVLAVAFLLVYALLSLFS